MPKAKAANLYAGITILLWASAYVMTKVALAYYTTFALGTLRYLCASLALLFVLLFKRIRLPRLRDIPLFFAAGAMGFTLYMITFNTGSITLTSTTSTIIIATSPVICALLARVLFREKIKALAWLAIAVELAGILTLTLWHGVFSIDIGILWMFAAAVLLSGYNLLQRHLTTRALPQPQNASPESPNRPQPQRYTAFETTTYSIFAGTLLLFIFLPQALPQLIAAPIDQILVVVYLGVFPSAIAYLCWSKALALAPTTAAVTNFMFVTPLLSMVIGYLVILEVPDISTFVGGVIILAGLVLFTWANKKASPADPSPGKVSPQTHHTADH